jgi:hypothetical protein
LSGSRDPRTLDSVLAEATLLLARCSLYSRFIKYHVTSDSNSLKSAAASEGSHTRQLQSFPRAQLTLEYSVAVVDADAPASLPKPDERAYDTMVRLSELTRQAYALTSHYIILEEAFLHGSVARVSAPLPSAKQGDGDENEPFRRNSTRSATRCAF